MHATSEKIIGIDLGTSNSKVAVLIDRQVVIIADEHGNTIIPSVVALNAENQLLIGREAKNQHALQLEKTISSIKHHMGKNGEMSEYLFCPLIKKNTPISVSKSQSL